VHKRNLKKILIVRLSSLGDVIQTLPIPTVVKQAYPEAEIGWVIDRELAPAIAGHDDLSRIHLCDRTLWSRSLANPREWGKALLEAKLFIDEIRAVGYDCALDVQGLMMSAIIPFFAGISQRIGFAHGREFSHLFYTERHVTKTEYFAIDRLHIDHMTTLTRAIGCDADNYSIKLPAVTDTAWLRVDKLLFGRFRSAEPLVAIAPATQWKSKAWPLEHWASLIDLILKQTKANILLIGTRPDSSTTSRLFSCLGKAAEGRLIDLTGATSIQELYALFQRVAVVVGADTAPPHIAAAAGCHVICLFGATPPLRTKPVGRGQVSLIIGQPRLACQPCQQRTCRYHTTECMRRLMPADVFAKVAEAIRTLNADHRAPASDFASSA
jgi:lipopolysaccharide heptosyltransferase I